MRILNAAGSCRKGMLWGMVVFLLLSPGFAVAQIKWAKNFDEAMKQAAKENKFFVLDISASW